MGCRSKAAGALVELRSCNPVAVIIDRSPNGDAKLWAADRGCCVSMGTITSGEE